MPNLTDHRHSIGINRLVRDPRDALLPDHHPDIGIHTAHRHDLVIRIDHQIEIEISIDHHPDHALSLAHHLDTVINTGIHIDRVKPTEIEGHIDHHHDTVTITDFLLDDFHHDLPDNVLIVDALDISVANASHHAV